MSTPPPIEGVALHEATRQRYLNYAMSVITARALPDVRDGLKPVQRRILYAMFHNLKLRPDQRYRKSAAVVGEVMAKYHPHGDQSIYDAMVRLAQPFSMRHMLVDGQGNFGSMDGDGAAAMRYTECKLRPIAVELLDEIEKRTVDYRANYDGQHQEPVVLPAQFPQLLVNGGEGIAVGMATRIPPHNLREVIDACVVMIDDPEADNAALTRKVKGPDFPTGGLILNTRQELRQIYEDGGGAVQLRGRWEPEQQGRRHYAVITEVPYAVNKAKLVEKIGDLVASRRLPQVRDVRDESTDEVRVVLELRSAADAGPAMAFLFKHTPLQTNYHVNLTCLVRGPNPAVGVPIRADLRLIIREWLDFRYETVRRRYEYELALLRKRIHILEGFIRIFDALDEAIRLIRASEGKADAKERLIDRFDLSDEQAEAILVLQLYRLAKTLIDDLRNELAEKLAAAAVIVALLASETDMWAQVKTELLELRKLYGERRRSAIGGDEVEELDYSEAAYIVAEKTFMIVTREGWIKRQGSFTDIAKIRVREGDAIGWIGECVTRSTVGFFTNTGAAYVMRVDDVPATSGYGDPVQRHFSFADGERVVGVVINDGLSSPPGKASVPAPTQDPDEVTPPPYCVAVSRKGRAVRFPAELHTEPSNKNGRRYMRPDGPEDAVVAAYVCDGSENMSIASVNGRALTYGVNEIKVVRGAGKGVTAIKLHEGDQVFAFELSRHRLMGAKVITPQGREELIRPSKFAGGRAQRGRVVLKRGRWREWVRETLRYDEIFADNGAQPELDPADDLEGVEQQTLLAGKD